MLFQIAAHCAHQANSFPLSIRRYLNHLINTYILDPSYLPPLLATIRQTLFPNNSLFPPPPSSTSPTPSTPPPTGEDLAKLKRKTAEDILSLLPLPLIQRIWGGLKREDDTEEQLRNYVEQEILSVWEDEWMNKWVYYRVLETVVVAILPELGADKEKDVDEEEEEEKTVKGLLERRGIIT